MGLLLASVSLLACAEEPAGTGSRGLAVRERFAPVQLAPRDAWVAGRAHGAFLVSPRFSPSGAWVLASGWRGTGLYGVARDGRVTVLSSAYRGPTRFLDDGTVCLLAWDDTASRSGRGARPPGFPAVRLLGPGRDAGGRCSVPRRHELGEVVAERPIGTVLQHPLRGELLCLFRDGSLETLSAQAPWSVAVSPTGEAVAFVTGSMRAPRLWLWRRGHGARPVGPGVHPAFWPDGEVVIYAVPTAFARRGGVTTVVSAELFAVALRTGHPGQLTQTPDIAEMSPAVSPAGDRVAFSDWRGGAVYLVPARRRRVP